MKVRTGLDRLAEDDAIRAKLRGRRVGLLAHAASHDRHLRHARVIVEGSGAELRVLFGPEHGYGGEAQDMVGVRGGAAGGVPIHSLYGESEADLSPKAEWLEGLDAVIVDLQDVGSRYYTFVWSAALMLRSAARAGVKTIVLDRPNPLGGAVIEGGAQRPGYRSFVGLYDVAVRHGMTIGELCHMVRALEGIDPEALEVVRCEGWRGEDGYALDLPWVLPSPNMPTLDTAWIYPGGCLIEGTSLSEGRGTTRPFEIWGAPGLDGEALARAVSAPGVTLRPLTFRPSFQKHAGKVIGGVQVHVRERGSVRSYALYLRMLAAARAQLGEGFAWRTETYEYVSDRPAIDLLTGGPEAREAIDRGLGLEEVIAREERGAAAFAESRREHLLYPRE